MKIDKLFFVIAFFASCTLNSSPKFRAEKNSQGIDTIKAGETKSISYPIYNDEKSDLVIEDFILSCDCTTSDINKGTKILPNSFLKVNFKIKTDSTEKSKNKILRCTIKTNSEPYFVFIKIPVYIK